MLLWLLSLVRIGGVWSSAVVGRIWLMWSCDHCNCGMGSQPSGLRDPATPTFHLIPQNRSSDQYRQSRRLHYTMYVTIECASHKPTGKSGLLGLCNSEASLIEIILGFSSPWGALMQYLMHQINEAMYLYSKITPKVGYLHAITKRKLTWLPTTAWMDLVATQVTPPILQVRL